MNLKYFFVKRTFYIRIFFALTVVSFFWYIYITRNIQASEYIILNEKNKRCLQQQDSLLLQLQLIQEYKLKIELELKNIKEQTSRELNKVMNELKKASDERDNFRNKYLSCNRTKKIDNNSNKDTVNEENILLIDTLKGKLNKYEESKKEDNEKLEIINGTLLQTQRHLDKCKTDLNLSLQQCNMLKNNQVPSDELNYVKENGVHFKRYQSKDKNLHFNRLNDNSNILDKILSPKELVQKIEAKNMEKVIEKDDKHVYNNKPNIIEDDLEPNGNEVDYKEMGEH